MQVIFKNKNERSNSRGANSMGIVVCTGIISGYMERECIRRSRIKKSGI